MEYNDLNILGFFEERMNILLELAYESIQVQRFNVIKNMQVPQVGTFKPVERFELNFYEFDDPEVCFNQNDIFAFSVVGNLSKEKVYRFFKHHFNLSDKQFVNLVHPRAYVSPSSRLDYGIQIEPLSSVSSLANIGFGVTLKRHSTIGHHSRIGNFVTVNPSAAIGGFSNIGDNVMIGMGANIIHNINIGENTIIGAGSVVVNDIPSNSVAYGNPCKVHKIIEHSKYN